MSDENAHAPTSRPTVTRRSTSSHFGFEKKRRAKISRSTSQEPSQGPETTAKRDRTIPVLPNVDEDNVSSSSDSESDRDASPVKREARGTSKSISALNEGSSLRSKDKMKVTKLGGDAWPGKAQKIVRTGGSGEEINASKDNKSPPRSQSATTAHSETSGVKRTTKSDNSTGAALRKPKLPTLELPDVISPKPKKADKGEKKDKSDKGEKKGKKDAKKAKTPRSGRRSKTPRAGDEATPADASAPPSSEQRAKSPERRAESDLASQENLIAVSEAAKNYGDTMAVHREKLAAAKLTLPSGLKHAATTRLFKTMRTRGSVADDDEDGENGANGSSPALIRSSSRRRMRRTRSLPTPPSWELRVPADSSSASLATLILSPSFDGGRRESQDSNVAGPQDAGSTESESENGSNSQRFSDADTAPNSARRSSADYMTAFEWLKTLDFKERGSDADQLQTELISDSESDGEKESSEVREETWKLIDEFDHSSDDSDMGGDDSPHQYDQDPDFDSAGDGDVEGFSSGTDGELQPITPRTIEMEAALKPGKERPKSIIMNNSTSHPTLRSMRGLRHLRVISTDGSETPSSEEASTMSSPGPQRRPERPSLALSSASVPNEADSGPISPPTSGRSRPKLVKMDRVTDLRGSSGSPAIQRMVRKTSGTVKVLRPSPQSSPRTKDSDSEDNATLVEEEGVQFLVRTPRPSRILADLTGSAEGKSDSPRSEISSSGKRIQKIVQAASFENLIGLIVTKPLRDTRFKSEFLASLPWFSSPVQLLEQLARIYSDPPAEAGSKAQSRIVELVNDWIERYFRYFLIEKSSMTSLIKFLDDTIITAAHSKHRDMLRRIVNYKNVGINPGDLLAVAVQMKSTKSGLSLGTGKTFQGSDATTWLRKSRHNMLSDSAAVEIMTQLLRDHLISTREDGGNDGSVTVRIAEAFSKSSKYVFAVSKEDEQRKTVEALLPVFLSKPMSSGSRFAGFHPDVFAKQLAVFEQNLYLKIEAHELHFWIKGEKDKRSIMAPNLCHVIQFINKMSNWVATEIVLASNPKQRVSMIKKFILVAQWCLKFKNYQGLLEVMGGLANTAVTRLSAWRELSSKYTDMHRKLQEVVSPQQNWKSYRPLIDREDPPCIPYVGLFLADLTFLSDGMPTKHDDGRINWKKMSRISTVLSKLERLQQVKYDYPIHPDVLKFLSEEIYAMDEKELFARSRAAEPGSSGRARSNSIV